MDANVDHLIKFYKKSKYVVLDVGGEKFKIQRKILREAINENIAHCRLHDLYPAVISVE